MAPATGSGAAAVLALVALVGVQVLVAVVYKAVQRDGTYPFAPMSVFAVAELVKLGIAVHMHRQQCAAAETSPTAWLAHPGLYANAAQIALLGLFYFVNNQLAFVLFLNADPASINLLKAGATGISALLWTVFLGRSIPALQWGCVALQICGMVLVQYDDCVQHLLLAPGVYAQILLAVTITALSGVWNERQLKRLAMSVFEQNMVLYAVGALLCLGGYVVQKFSDPTGYPGFFDGYWGPGIVVVLLNSLMGVVVTAVYVYADAVVKTLGSALTTVVVVWLSHAWYGLHLTAAIACGSAVVVIASTMYLTLEVQYKAAAAAAADTVAAAAVGPEAGQPAGGTDGAPRSASESSSGCWASIQRRRGSLASAGAALLVALAVAALLVALGLWHATDVSYTLELLQDHLIDAIDPLVDASAEG